MGCSLLQLVVVSCSLGMALSAPVLMVIGPDVFYYGRQESISITLLNHDHNVQVVVTLMDPAKSTTLSRETITVRPNNAAMATLEVNPDELPVTDPPASHVVIKVEAAAIAFTKESRILLSSESHLVYIQTDKPLYTPRQQVHVRVFTMDHEMQPVDLPVRLDLMTPQGIIIERTLLQDDRGINVHNYRFPDMSMQGNWSWVASYGYQLKQNVTAKFEVKDYELPSFEVKVFPLEYILPTATHITGYIEARHSYGEIVSGIATIKMYFSKGEDPMTYFAERTQRLDNENGRMIMDMPLEDLTGLGPRYSFPAIEGGRLYIEATVRELSTGKRMTTIDQTAVFASSPYTINYERSSRFFKPSLPYVVRMNVLFANGQPAGGVRVQVTAEATSSTGEKSVVESYIPGGGQQQNQLVADAEGRVRHTLNVSPLTRSIVITARTVVDGFTEGQQAEAPLTITAYSSPSDSYMMIRPKVDVVQVGLMEAEVFITNAGQHTSRLTYMVISRGKVRYQATKDRSPGTFTTLHIPISADMAPSLRLLAYYVNTETSEVLVDSVWVDVENICENEMTMTPQPPKAFYTPSDNMRILLTGQPGSRVLLQAVDKSVFFLNDKRTLTRKKMFERLAEQDLGCTPGGGQDNAGVFKDAGLFGLTNVNLAMGVRSAVFCREPGRKKRSTNNPTMTNLGMCCREGQRIEGNVDMATCRRNAANLEDASVECKNRYFFCCKKTLETNSTKVDEDRSERRGRINGGRAASTVSFKLIVRNEDNIPVRSKFDESWQMPTRTIGENGQVTVPVTLKDTITTWVVQAVGVSPTKGMCVHHPINIKVFKRTFLKVDLPRSAIRLEQLEVKATLYNYANSRIGAILNLEANDNVCYGARSGQDTEDIRVEIEPGQSRVITWPIIPLEAGNAILKIKAYTTAENDIVEKVLVVIPPGKPKTTTKTIVLDPLDILSGRNRRDVGPPDNIKTRTHVNLTMPAEAIPGSERCFLTLTGKVMGPVVEQLLAADGLNHLIRLPRGCGEQTLIRLGPLVYVAKYLRASGQTGDREQNIHNKIRSGVNHEMQYRRPGGGFAVWTTRSPSTWLTAFAVKIFSQARDFNILDGDPDAIVCTAADWMSQQQKPEGNYFDGYRVHHREMTGGVQGEATFTAYVLIGLLQSGCDRPRIEQSVEVAVNFLETQIDGLATPYSKAIVAYALSLANSLQVIRANNNLKTMAVYEEANGIRYWPANPAVIQGTKPYWYTKKPLAIEIETAAYALLTQLRLDDVDYANPIVKWLLSQRQANGAYISTQDTVIALEALSEYTMQTANTELDITCDVTAQSDRKGQRVKRFIVNEENAEVHQLEDVTSYIGGNLLVETEGEGVGQIQMDLTYNVATTEAEECHFDLSIEVAEYVEQPDDGIEDDEFEDEDDDDDGFGGDDPEPAPQQQVQENQAGSGNLNQNPLGLRGDQPSRRRSRFGGRNAQNNDGNNNNNIYRLTVCTRYRGDQETGMAILDVGLFTGYEAIRESLDELEASRIIDSYELTDRSVQIYLRSVPIADQKCVNIRIMRGSLVMMTHPVVVSIYDYYETSISCSKFYHPEGQEENLQTLCDRNQEVCKCAETKCGECYGMHSYEVLPWTTEDMMRKTCSDTKTYALKIRVDRIGYNAALEIVTATVLTALKKGEQDIRKNQEIQFQKKSACPCPSFMQLGVYFIIGRHDGTQYLNEQGQTVYKYMIDDSTYVINYMDKKTFRRGGTGFIEAGHQHRWFKNMRNGGCQT